MINIILLTIFDVLLVGSLIGGGIYMIRTHMSAEKRKIDSKMPLPFYNWGSKWLGWGLLVSGIFILLGGIIAGVAASIYGG